MALDLALAVTKGQGAPESNLSSPAPLRYVRRWGSPHSVSRC